MHMSVRAHSRAPWYFTFSAWAFLLWSALAAFDDTMGWLMRDAYFKASGMSPAQVNYFSTLPLVVKLASTVSIWSGMAGAVALLTRRRMASIMFAIAALGTAVFTGYTWFLSAGIAAMGMLWFMPAVIGGVTIVLAVYAVRLAGRGFLR